MGIDKWLNIKHKKTLTAFIGFKRVTDDLRQMAHKHKVCQFAGLEHSGVI